MCKFIISQINNGAKNPVAAVTASNKMAAVRKFEACSLPVMASIERRGRAFIMTPAGANSGTWLDVEKAW